MTNVAGFGKHDTSLSVGVQNIWHRQGVVLDAPPTVEEAIKASGLDWEVELQPIQTTSGLLIPDRQATVRKDTNEPLGVFGKQYKPVQNIQAFKFFNEFIEQGVATIDTAGSLHNGRIVWILAKLNQSSFEVGKDDVVEKYILLCNSHNGSTSLNVGFVPIRVVCQNTLTVANKSEELLHLRHCGDVIKALDDVQTATMAFIKGYKVVEDMYKELHAKSITASDLKKYVYYVSNVNDIRKKFDSPSYITDDQVKEFRNKLMDRVEEVFETEKVYTMWGAYNAVNNYYNHCTKNPFNKVALTGYNDDAQAFNIALNMARK